MLSIKLDGLSTSRVISANLDIRQKLCNPAEIIEKKWLTAYLAYLAYLIYLPCIRRPYKHVSKSANC